MVASITPFTREEHSILIDTTLNRFPTRPAVVGKLREYHTFPAFSIPNVWRGASEIILRFDFPVGLTNLLNVFPLTPPTGANFVPVISWLKDEVYYRYKLWKDVGEILWLPSYNRQKVTADWFSIEIWNTNSEILAGLGLESEDGGLNLGGDGLLGLESSGIFENITLSEAIKIYGSRLHIPISPFCDLNDISLGSPTECVDPIYHLEDFEPLYGDYYLLINPCTRQLIKGVVIQPVYNLLKNRDDNTWHSVWMYVDPVTSAVQLEVYPDNVIPPADALGYFPMHPVGDLKHIYKFELQNGPDGTGNYFVFDTLTEVDTGINVVLLEDGVTPNPAVLYGFYLRDDGFGNRSFEVIQNQI